MSVLRELGRVLFEGVGNRVVLLLDLCWLVLELDCRYLIYKKIIIQIRFVEKRIEKNLKKRRERLQKNDMTVLKEIHKKNLIQDPFALTVICCAGGLDQALILFCVRWEIIFGISEFWVEGRIRSVAYSSFTIGKQVEHYVWIFHIAF